jgi:hypothetical protein
MTADHADALAPLERVLLSTAQADAQQLVDRARAQTARQLAQSRRQAEAILAEARRQGEADAAAELASERAAARREAREGLLRARREAYDELRARCRAAGTSVVPAPSRLAEAARRILGDGATVRPADGGGIVAETSGRRVDLSATRFVDLALAELGWQLFDGTAAPGSPWGDAR